MKHPLQLRKAHPSESIPQPPPKDRSYVSVPIASPAPSSTASTPPPAPYSSGSSSRFPHATPPISPSSTSMGRSPTKPSRQYSPMPGVYELEMTQSNASFESSPTSSPPGAFPTSSSGSGYVGVQYASKLTREKNRLTLRSYLHVLLSSSKLGSSPVLKSFLLSDPTRLRYGFTSVFIMTSG